jgi:chromosomal replication initiation ATPase DnaA
METQIENLKLAAFEGFGDSPISFELNIESILEAVSFITSIPKELIINCSRKREVIRSRQYVVIFSQCLTPIPTLSLIGKYLGKGHASILASKRRAKGLLDVKDSFIMFYFDRIKKSLHISDCELNERLKNIN